MKYEIKGENFPIVILTLENGESILTESGSMQWMSEGFEMKTEGGGGIGKALGRLMAGESMFRNIYTATSDNSMIALGSSVPGSIKAIEVTPDNPVIIQKSSYLASTDQIKTEVFVQKQMKTGLFGGEGFIMQKISGQGIVFVEIFGSVMEYDLKENEKLIIDTGSFALMQASCKMDIQTVKGFKNIVLGGEGLFLTNVTGPGKVIVQTMKLSAFANLLVPFMPRSNN
ncbi:MAG: TIGR00266 family protein [Lachnospiraceae bacterium]|nr:TIGR00266 family protein [Lachnospiraceae bacterium]